MTLQPRLALLAPLLVLTAACAPAVGVPAQRSALTGKDGAKTVAGTETVNRYAALSAPAAANDTSLTVADATGFSAGDLVLLVASQGATIDTSNTSAYGTVSALGAAGLNEMWVLSAVNLGTGVLTLDLGCGLTGLQNAYPLTAHPQVVRVPQYTTLSVPAGATLTGTPWNGTVGGYVVVHVESAASIDGTIQASGLGLRGGAVSLGSSVITGDITSYVDATAQAAEKGESMAGDPSAYDALGGRYGRGAPANGGGGGNGYLAGGGGGAGLDAVNAATYSGQGTMAGSVVGGAAWALDPGDASSGGPGGGRGGYTLSALDQDALTVAPGVAAWGGNGRLERGGLGGHAITTASRLVLGGGGGAGDYSGAALPASVSGARGGGVVYLIASTLAGAGSIRADGEAGRDGQIVGTNDGTTVATGGGAGGGGGGGMVLLRATGSPSLLATARGGPGGNLSLTGTFALGLSAASGAGGGGAGGSVGAFSGLTLTTAPLVGAGLGGTTSAPALAEFPSNGASAGDAGVSTSAIPQASPPKACLPADLSITLVDSADPVDTGTPYSYTATIANGGPNAAYALSAAITLPAGVTPGTVTAAGWSCSQVGQVLTCTRAILRAGQSTNITLAVTAPSSGGTVNATATITSSEDPAVANNSASASTLVQQPTADLSLTQSAPSATASAETFTYSLTVDNGGPRSAPSVKIVDTLPAGVAFISASGAGWTCVNASGTVTCTHGSLANGVSSSVALLVSAPALTSTTALTNTATVSINSSGTVDPASANDTVSANASITPVDLSITKVDVSDPVPASAAITYTLTVTNPANVAVHQVVVDDPLPAGTSFVSASGTGWTCALVAAKVQCTTPTIAAAPTVTPSITVVLTAPSTPSVIANTATVSATATDPTLANNTATEQTTISPPAPGSANLSVIIADAPDPVSIGTALAYTITVANAGPDPAAGAQVVSTLPVGATLISATGTSWTCAQAGTTVTCQHTGTIALGVAPSILVALTAPPSPGMLSTSVVVTATTPDPAVGNNFATELTTVIDPTAINQAPVLTLPVMLSTLEDTPLTFAGATAPLIADPDAGNATVELRVSGASCVFTLARTTGLELGVGDGILDPDLVARGSIADLNAALDGASAMPVPNYSGKAQLSFTVNDLGHSGAGGAQQTSGELSFAVIDVDDPPLARDDELTVVAGVSDARIDVLANDSAGDIGQSLTLVAVDQPAHGSAQIATSGDAILYTPTAGYVGDDGFAYTISDGHGQTSGQVIVHVKGIDVPIDGVTVVGGGVGCAMTARPPPRAGALALILIALALARRKLRRA